MSHNNNSQNVASKKVLVDDNAAVAGVDSQKNQPDIDGPQQDSQETDDVYVDSRANKGLPAGGKNVGDLNVNDLSQDGNKI